MGVGEGEFGDEGVAVGVGGGEGAEEEDVIRDSGRREVNENYEHNKQ